jgi:hypothetical protein
MVLLRWFVHLNDGGTRGATVRVTTRTATGKSGQGGGLLRFLYRAKGSDACG